MYPHKHDSTDDKDDNDDDNNNDSYDDTSDNKNKSSSSSLIPEGVLPSYLATAFGELYEDDGLIVMAKGLGWLNLLASFVRFYADVEQGHLAIVQENAAKSSSSPSSSSSSSRTKPPLVLVLGLKDAEHDALLSILDSWGTPHRMMPKIITNESGQGKDRIGTLECARLSCSTAHSKVPSPTAFDPLTL